MKRIMAIAVAVVMVITVFAMVGPVSAGPPDNPAVFEANIVPTSWGTHPLDEGEVKVKADGSVEVKIEGAMADTTYYVWFGQQVGQPTGGWTPTWAEIGSFTTDTSGDGKFELDADSIPSPVTAPVFAINHPERTVTQFVSGF